MPRKNNNYLFYFNLICKYDLISREEEQRLATARECGDDKAREKLILSNLKLVIATAFKYVNSSIDIEDLIQAGNIGLMRAAEKYQPGTSASFATYALYWIKTKIIRYIIRNRHVIFTSIDGYNKAKKIISGKMDDCSQQDIKNAENYIKGEQLSIDAAIDNDDKDKTFFEEFEADNKVCGPSDIFISRENIDKALNAMDTVLSPRERQTIMMRYGLEDENAQTLGEIGAKFKLSKEMVRLIEKEALMKLRRELEKD